MLLLATEIQTDRSVRTARACAMQKHRMPNRKAICLTVWDARRPASVRGTSVSLLLKHGSEVFDRAHGCDLRQAPRDTQMVVSVENAKLAAEVATRVVRLGGGGLGWVAAGAVVFEVNAPFWLQLPARRALELPTTEGDQWKANLCGLLPGLRAFNQRVEGAMRKQRTDLRRAEGDLRGGTRGGTRGDTRLLGVRGATL